MGKVAYGQRGYVGSSMSMSSAESYAAGEAPKSKWTRRAMLDAIAAYLDDSDLAAIADFAGMTKARLWDGFFEVKGRHRTGKSADETDFYGLDEDAVEEASRPMTGEERAAREAERAAGRAARKAEVSAVAARDAARKEEAARRRAEWEADHGCPYDSLAGVLARDPNLALRISKRGHLLLVHAARGPVVNLTADDGVTKFAARLLHKKSIWLYDGSLARALAAEFEATRDAMTRSRGRTA